MYEYINIIMDDSSARGKKQPIQECLGQNLGIIIEISDEFGHNI